MDRAITLLDAVRAAGNTVTADVYPYTASSTGLTTIILERYHEGGRDGLYQRLRDPAVRRQIREDLSSGRLGDVTDPENILVRQVRADELREYQGNALA